MTYYSMTVPAQWLTDEARRRAGLARVRLVAGIWGYRGRISMRHRPVAGPPGLCAAGAACQRCMVEIRVYPCH